jgi:hypothetical protein
MTAPSSRRYSGCDGAIMAELDLSQGWRIASGSDHPTATLAAVELDRCLSTIAGRRAGPEDGQRVSIALTHREGGDGFLWRCERDRVELHGEGPRGLLYATYSLLEALGCRWAWPGERGRRLPRGVRFTLPDAAVEEAPALASRCLVIGHRAFLVDVEEWIRWAACNRLNAIFIHVAQGRDPFGAAPEQLWQELAAMAVRHARERGMTIEHGGHLMPRLARRRELEQHFQTHPNVDVFHLWREDSPPPRQPVGSEISDRALADANAAAELLEDIDPSAVLSFLAYHETEQVPASVMPRRNVCLLWAPRERCYSHPIDGEGCPLNRRYRETFLAQLEHFRTAGAAPARVFEYYLDSILFRPAPPPLADVIRRDLAFYRDTGVHAVQALMTGYGPWDEPHPNAWLFARLAWDPARNSDALLREFCEVVFGSDAPAHAQRLRTLEREASRSLARARRD